MKSFISMWPSGVFCLLVYVATLFLIPVCIVSAERYSDFVEKPKKFPWDKFGSAVKLNAPPEVKESKEMMAMYIAGKVAEEMKRQNYTPNYNFLTRITNLYQDWGTCGNCTEILGEALSGAGYECTEVKVESNWWTPNGNHGASAVVINGKVLMFDMWQHGRVGHNFGGFMSNKWNGMSYADWISEMRKQGYLRVTLNQDDEVKDRFPIDTQQNADKCIQGWVEEKTHLIQQREKVKQLENKDQTAPADKDIPPQKSGDADDSGKKTEVKGGDTKDTMEDSLPDEGKSKVSEFQRKLDEARSNKSSSVEKEGDLMDAEGASESDSLYDLVSRVYQSGKKTYEGGKAISGSWWESFFGSSEERDRQSFEATQSSADAVLSERQTALDAARNREESEAAQRDMNLQDWLSKLAAQYEAERKEAQWRRENSWGAWLQSVAMDTVRGVSGGFGSSFGNRLGSGIIEHEISKDYPETSTTTGTASSGSGNVSKGTSPGVSTGANDKTKSDKTPSGGKSKGKSKPKTKVKPGTRSGPTTINTIDGKPFQPPPDGRNTGNEVTPTPPKPPAPAHWYCFRCGGDRGVDGGGACACRPAGVNN